MLKIPNTNINTGLLLTAVMAVLVCYLISLIIPIDKMLAVVSGIIVYLIAIGKDIFPKILEKHINNGSQDEKLLYYLHKLENRLEETYQTALKAQASIEASFVDEYLEEERINTKKILQLEQEIVVIKKALESINEIIPDIKELTLLHDHNKVNENIVFADTESEDE